MLCKCCASFIPLRMATIKAFIRTTKDSEVKIRFRLSDGRKVQLYFISHIMVYPSLWDSKKECIKQRAMCQIAYREVMLRLNALTPMSLSSAVSV